MKLLALFLGKQVLSKIVDLCRIRENTEHPLLMTYLMRSVRRVQGDSRKTVRLMNL